MPCQPHSHIRVKHTAVFRQTDQLFNDLKEQGFAEVHRVMVKTEAEVVPTNTLFLTFKLNTSELLKASMAGYLKVKVTFLFQTRCDVTTATSLATPANVAKLLQSVSGVENINMKIGVRDPSCALTAMIHLPQWLKIA